MIGGSRCLRPDVVRDGEDVPSALWDAARQALLAGDAVIVAGTRARKRPMAMLLEGLPAADGLVAVINVITWA